MCNVIHLFDKTPYCYYRLGRKIIFGELAIISQSSLIELKVFNSIDSL